jgi:hypothetical protein
MECMVNVYHDAIGCSDDELPQSLQLYLKDDNGGSLIQEQDLPRPTPTEPSSSNAVDSIYNDDSGDSGVEEDYALCKEKSNLPSSHTKPSMYINGKEKQKSRKSSSTTYLTNK